MKCSIDFCVRFYSLNLKQRIDVIMKTFLTVMIFTCLSCFALNADEQKQPAKEKDMCVPKKEVPAQLFSACSCEKEKTDITPVPAEKAKLLAVEEEKTPVIVPKDKLLVAKERTPTPKIEQPLFAMEQKDMTKPVDPAKKEEDKKVLPAKTIVAVTTATVPADEKIKEEKPAKLVA